MKILICLTLFILCGFSKASEELNLINTIWGYNNGYTSSLLVLKKENKASLFHTSDSGPTQHVREGTYQVKNKSLTISFPELIEHNVPAFKTELIIYSNKKQKYLAGAETYKLTYMGKYPPSGDFTIPITN